MPESPLFGIPMLEGGSDYPSPDAVADAKQINDQFKYIEQYLGADLVTSGTLPSSPKTNQLIYETDTKKLRVWDGSTWLVIFDNASIEGRAWNTAYRVASAATALGGGTVTVNADGSVSFSGVQSFRLEDVFSADDDYVYEVVLNVRSTSGTISGVFASFEAAGDAAGTNQRARRQGFGTGAWVASDSGPVTTPTVLPGVGTGTQMRMLVHEAGHASEQTKAEFAAVSDNNNGEYYTGIIINNTTREDDGIRIGVLGGGNFTGKVHVRRVY